MSDKQTNPHILHYLNSIGLPVTRTNIKVATVLIDKGEPLAMPNGFTENGNITYKPHFMFGVINRIKENDK